MKTWAWLALAALAYGWAKIRAYKGLTMSPEGITPAQTFDGPGFIVRLKIFNGGWASAGIESLTGDLLQNGRPVGTVRIPQRFTVPPGQTRTVEMIVANLKLPLLDMLTGGTSGLQVRGRARLPIGIDVNFLEDVS